MFECIDQGLCPVIYIQLAENIRQMVLDGLFTDIQCLSNIMIAEPWVTAIDVARHLGVVKDTVYRWRERKGLPAHKIGRLWKFQLSEVDEWVRAGGADEDSNIHAQQK